MLEIVHGLELSEFVKECHVVADWLEFVILEDFWLYYLIILVGFFEKFLFLLRV